MSTKQEADLPQRPQRKRREKQTTADQKSAAQQVSCDFKPPPETQAGRAPAQLESSAAGQPEGANYEYLDHPADVQLHSWGTTLEEAFEGAALAMFNYMTPLKDIKVNKTLTRTYEAEGHDLHTLLFQYLDEMLFVFATEMFVPCKIAVTQLDRSSWKIKATGRGETFSKSQHVQGTEVKAITYSAMQVIETNQKTDIYVIVDI
ncbi:hypothetical protein WJX84_005309 [Apatococcus fuscideae]|uniref:Archease domain-containing protein n=1 Tax=Apatococcus fuscideae TaxID=2026836 RepID=A0AAW1SXX2_9CHLO